MLTPNGIELDLKESKYISSYENYTFYFSSEIYKNKFEEKLTAYIILENAKMKNKYKSDLKTIHNDIKDIRNILKNI